MPSLEGQAYLFSLLWASTGYERATEMWALHAVVHEVCRGQKLVRRDLTIVGRSAYTVPSSCCSGSITLRREGLVDPV
jgi:hypothetical protein